MFYKFIIALSFINIFLFTACGSSSSQEQSSTGEASLKNIELYNANLKLVNGSRRYDVEKFDASTSALTPLYFNFETKDFTVRSEEKEIFVEGQRNSFSNIDYAINSDGQLVASVNAKDIYALELLSTQAVKSSRVEAYQSDIDIEGIAYEVETHYLANYLMIEKLVTADVFTNLTDFTKVYENKIFLGNYLRGLVFKENNKLQERKDGNYTDAGSYEIKTLDNVEVIMIYPDDSNYYYSEDSCYVLNFSRVWKSKCYVKDSKSQKTFYDKNVYDDLLLYLKEKFVILDVSL